MILVLDTLSVWASERRFYIQCVGSRLTETHSNFWQNTMFFLRDMSVTWHVRTQDHSQEKRDGMPSLLYAAVWPAPLSSCQKQFLPLLNGCSQRSCIGSVTESWLNPPGVDCKLDGVGCTHPGCYLCVQLWSLRPRGGHSSECFWNVGIRGKSWVLNDWS